MDRSSPSSPARARARAVVRTAAGAAFLTAALVAPAAADTVRLRSGDVVEGKVEDLGDRLAVDTQGGPVSVRWRDVECVLPGRSAADEYAERRRGVKDADAAGLYALGLWALRAGLADESRTAFEAAVKADPEHAGAREALAQQKAGDAWLGGSKLLEAKGFVARDGQWLLREEADLRSRQAEARRELSVDEKRVEDLLAKAGTGPEAGRKFAVEALAKMPAAELVRPALRALRRGETGSRVAAAGILGRVKDEPDILRPLLRTAVLDRDRDVRFAAAGALREIGNEQVARPLAKAMWSERPEVRGNAAEALGELGGAASVEWLITRAMTSGGPGGRVNFFAGSQVTYISDFDVEIAQAAQIGDPIVQTIREGVSLDCRVMSVREEFTVAERRVVYMSLRRATGKDFGEDATAWKSWFDKDGRKELTAMAAAAAAK